MLFQTTDTIHAHGSIHVRKNILLTRMCFLLKILHHFYIFTIKCFHTSTEISAADSLEIKLIFRVI